MERYQSLRQVQGHIFQSGVDDDDSSDEDDEEPWLDYRDFNSAGSVVKPKSIKIRRVTIGDTKGPKYPCRGKFPLIDIFWTVTAKISRNGWLKCSPMYSIRLDKSFNNRQNTSHVMMLLDDSMKSVFKSDYKEIKERERNATKACFELFCRHSNRTPSLFNLESLLKEYLQAEEKECQLEAHSNLHKEEESTAHDHRSNMRFVMHESDLAITAFRAISHPDLVEITSVLLPSSFQNFLQRLSKKDREMTTSVVKANIKSDDTSAIRTGKQATILACKTATNFSDKSAITQPDKSTTEVTDKAATMAKESVWEYGFRPITKRKLGIGGVEAHLFAFEKGDFLSSMPQKYKDALYLYETLKLAARKGGHMYLPFKEMIQSYFFKILQYPISELQRWIDALEYLKQNDVIVIEKFDHDDNIFLKYNWQAEVDTVSGVNKILSSYFPMNDDLQFDFSSQEFDNIRKDPDQVKALNAVAQFPITVMSGSGGCGKTTVITTLLKHICNREEERLEAKDRFEKEQAKIEKKKKAKDQCEESFKSKIRTDSSEIRNDNAISIGMQMDPLSSQRQKLSKSSDVSNISSNNEEEESSSASSGEVDESDLRKVLVSDLIKILKQERGCDSSSMKEFKSQFLLTAPTGKAARLLGCKASLPSATIHSVILSHRMHQLNLLTPKAFLGDRSSEEDEKEWKYAKVKVLVVDECSLVSVFLFAHLITILNRHSKLRKVILLGDIKQLPSIDPGDFLRDVFKSLSSPHLSVKLTNNHRSESSLIVENAQKVSQMRMPTIDPAKRFYFVQIEEEGVDGDRDAIIRELLKSNSDLLCHVQSQFVAFRNIDCHAINELCSKHYNSHSTRKATESNKKEVQDFRTGDKICLGKNGKVTNYIKVLLEYLEDNEFYKKNYIRSRRKKVKEENQGTDGSSTSNRNVLTAAETTSLFDGDEDALDKTVVEMKEKGYALQREKKERLARAAAKSKAWKAQRSASSSSSKDEPKMTLPFKSEDKLCNGEVFFIMDIKTVHKQVGTKLIAENYFILSDRDPHLPNVMCVEERDLRKCKMKHSWARTIHTYQGSESQTVVYVVEGAKVQNWQHVYTAITRGKKSVYIVGKPSQLQTAVQSRDKPRYSRLCTRMKDMFLESSHHLDKIKQHISLSQRPSQTTMSFPCDISYMNSSEAESDDSLLCTLLDPPMDMQGAPLTTKRETDDSEGEVEGERLVKGVYKTPPKHARPESDGLSPSKMMKVEQSSSMVDTPFRTNFSQALSMDGDEGNSEDESPTPTLRRKAVQRKFKTLF